MKLASRLMVWLLVFGFLLGNLIKVPIITPEIKVSALDIAVITALATTLLKSKKFDIFKLPLVKPFLVFGLIALVSLLLSYFSYGFNGLLVGSAYLVRFVLYSLSFIVISSQQAKATEKWLSVGVPVLCLIQYLFLPDVRFLEVAEWDPHYYRVVGTFLDPGFTSIILVFLLFRPTLSGRVLWLLTYLMFALTYSRSGYLAFILASAFVASQKKSWSYFFTRFLLIAATLILLPRAPGGEGVKLERTSSITARIINWHNSLTIFADHPVIGTGFNTYRYAQKEYGFLSESKWLKSHAGAGADSSLLFVLATTGLVGFIFYLKYLNQVWRLTSQDYYLQTCLVALFAHSLFLNSQFYPFVLFWLSLQISQSLRLVHHQ
ncbi:hypothetical protein A2397_00335 [Candidatus Amesbacteria bacterium RIFOXYB1_FULL_44_23]|uniref:O-antigen ligase-related domain-containing protein n=1 Tax=Candidatus Amesbacteria bacterium RIFOXYB1_FULL_44_23 TaxID=1797263 RepID=A0A1F4ZX39_9BACT|nr:MAG: hypothetical protein A2397_00335 [Candidatus Amesbacteria bacterium RIFOXYB1_FULL_44_23]